MVLHPQLLAKVSECVIVKLFSIVRDEDLRNSELVDDAFPNKVTVLQDGCQWFCFYPFGEVVDPPNKELELSYCH